MTVTRGEDQPGSASPPSESAAILERLLTHRTLGAAPRQELAWLADHGTLQSFEKGRVLVTKGAGLQGFGLWIILSGHFAIFVDRGAGPKRVMDWRGGDVSGALPYSRMSKSLGDGIALEEGELLQIDPELFPEMTRDCPAVTAMLVHVMLDRARQFTSSDLHDEKMISLGKIAAGLAHELNNPASAAARSAALLEEALSDVAAAARELGAAQISEDHIALLDRVRVTCTASAAAELLSPIQRAEREDEIADWLHAHAADEASAPAFADSGATVAMLDGLASELDKRALAAALRWIAADCSARTLASDVRKAASRIYDLVDSVKRFSYMDLSAAPETLDVTQGLRDTVAVLRSKATGKNAELTLDVAPSLPSVHAVGGELNQVWSNLIDNALDAVGVGGHVRVSARAELNAVVVRINDDGPGVPPELLDQIFDPFFTTKAVGQGTGLGLDIARRLVRRHSGDIETESRPGGGHTEFRVTLPIARSE